MIYHGNTTQHWLRRFGVWLLTWRWGVLIGLLVLNAFAVVGLHKIQFDLSRDSLFLPDDPLTIATDEFRATFGNSDYAAVLVEADDVFAPEILSMIRELGQELEENVPFADDVVSLTDLEFTRGTTEGVEIGDLVPKEIPTDPSEIEAIRELAFSRPFLVNRLFSEDSRQAWVLLRLDQYPDDISDPDDTPENLVGRHVIEIIQQDKYQSPSYTLKSAGPPPFFYEMMTFYAREAGKLMSFMLVAAFLVLLLFLRSLRGVAVPMMTALSSILWTFGAMGHLGITINNTVITLPIFAGMAVSIGYSIHLFNFFNRRFAVSGNRQDSILYAIAETGWPIFFTAATTIGALLSFYFVPIAMVRWMGLSAAAVIFATYLIVMTLTPVALSFGENKHGQDTPRFQSRAHLLTNIDQWLEEWFAWLAKIVQRHPTPILIVFVLLTIVCLGGLPCLRVGVSPKTMDGLRVPTIRQFYEIGATKVGTVNSYNITLSFDEPNHAKVPEVLQNLDQLGAEVLELPYVKRVSSLLDVIKDMNQVMHEDDPAYYRIPDKQELVSQLLLLYEMSDGTEQENWVDYAYTILRLQVEVGDFETGEIERQFRQIKQRAAHLFPDARFGMVGGLVEIAKTQSYVSRGEVISFLIALVVIGVLMMLVFRSVKAGLIGMIPNITPVLVVGGLMGYLDISMDMATMMIIPLLLGLAVDDTIHFINHCRVEFQRTGNYQQAIELTFRTVGKAIFMTSFILTVTFLVYLTSIVNFFNNLAILASAGIISALLADYFITPILVVRTKPYGKPALRETSEEVRIRMEM